MDREQDRFYEDEELDPREDAPQTQEEEGEEVNDMKFFLELLRHIRAAIESGTNVPFTGKKVVDADKCLMIIDDLEKNLPDAVQYGMRMYSERSRIMGEAEDQAMKLVSSSEMRAQTALEKARQDAKRIVMEAQSEATAILDDAQERADRMVDESEIVRQAREEAKVLKNDARVEASEMRLKARHDAYQMLSSVEDQMVDACKSIRRRRTELGDEDE